jgi:hypothetical protein
MNEINLQALANDQTALQSHRGGTGEIRYTTVDVLDGAGRPCAPCGAGDTMTVRAASQASAPTGRALFQIAIVDVDTGIVVTTASTSIDGVGAASPIGVIDCRFPRVPLRPRHYVLRLSITDEFQLASYDTVSAGPRFAVVSQGAGVDALADEQEGLVSLPFEMRHTTGEPVGPER